MYVRSSQWQWEPVITGAWTQINRIASAAFYYWANIVSKLANFITHGKRFAGKSQILRWYVDPSCKQREYKKNSLSSPHKFQSPLIYSEGWLPTSRCTSQCGQGEICSSNFIQFHSSSIWRQTGCDRWEIVVSLLLWSPCIETRQGVRLAIWWVLIFSVVHYPGTFCGMPQRER